MTEAPASITLHSSWRGIVAAFAGSSLLLLAGATGVAVTGWRVFPTSLLALGVVFVAGVAADYPIASTFTADGVERRALLRRHRIAWERVDQLSRARPGLLGNVRRMVLGGLVAVIGRRRYLLVDQVESGPEHDRLEAVLGEWGRQLELDRLTRPSDDVTPTWVYRRPRWAPDEAPDR